MNILLNNKREVKRNEFIKFLSLFSYIIENDIEDEENTNSYFTPFVTNEKGIDDKKVIAFIHYNKNIKRYYILTNKNETDNFHNRIIN